MGKGWVKLHRDIMDHPFYTEKRKFSKYEAWIDILMLANHADNKFIHGNKIAEVERGSFITSEMKLMDRWGWSKEKLRSFLKICEEDGMILKISDRKQTTIKVLNYEVYQQSTDQEQTENRPPADHEQTASRPQTVHKQEVKNLSIKELNSYATTGDEIEFSKVKDRYFELHGRELKPMEWPIVSNLLKSGLTADQINEVMGERKRNAVANGRNVNGFAYYEPAIKELLESPKPSGFPRGPKQAAARYNQMDRLQELYNKAKEEEARAANGGY